MKVLILASLLAAALVLVPGSAVADSVEGDTPQTVPVIDVVITADRVLTDIVSTAAHVSIITADDIRQSGATNVVELLQRQPGVSFRSVTSEAQAQVDMRGFGEGSSGRVLVLIDGRKQNNPDMSQINWLGIAVDSIERIEIVRGSASALYGNHAVGGVINIITRTPERPLELSAAGSFGSFETNQQRVGIATAGKHARLRASAEHFSTDGHRHRLGYRALNFSLAGEFDPTDRLSLSLGGRYANIFYELPGGLTKEEFEDDPSQAVNEEDEATENQFGVDAGVDWRIGDRAALELPLGYSLKLVQLDMESWSAFTDTDLHTLTASPAFVVDWDAGAVTVRSRFGIDGSWARQDGRGYTSADRDDKFNEFTLGQWTVGAVLSNTVHLSERFDASATLRYDRSTIWVTHDQEDNPGAGEDLDNSVLHQAIVFDLGAVFRPTVSAKVYVSGGTFFRYPFLDEHYSYGYEAFGVPVPAEFNIALDPERGFTVEVGGGFYRGRRLRADLSFYLLQMSDEIALDETWTNVNLDETRRIGGDLQLSGEPIELLRFAAGYSYVHAVFVAGDDEGNRVPLVPEHSVDAELAVRPLAGIEVGPAVTFRSEAYQAHWNDPYAEDMIDAYLLTDLFVRVRPEGLRGDLSLSAEVKNLFDVSYAPLVFSNAYYPAPGRSFRVSAAYSY